MLIKGLLNGFFAPFDSWYSFGWYLGFGAFVVGIIIIIMLLFVGLDRVADNETEPK